MYKLCAFTLTSTVTPFSAHAPFTMGVIDRLKVSAGISLVDELAEHNPTFPAVAGVNVRVTYRNFLEQWVLRDRPHPPTWEELFRALKKMGLSDLAVRIEKYMSGSVSELTESPGQPSEREGLSEEEEGKSSIVCVSHTL